MTEAEYRKKVFKYFTELEPGGMAHRLDKLCMKENRKIFVSIINEMMDTGYCKQNGFSLFVDEDSVHKHQLCG